MTFADLFQCAAAWNPVQLQEYEIRYLCAKSHEIFINRPILLEFEVPIKIFGETVPCWPEFTHVSSRHPYDISRLSEYGGFPPEANYLVLGDYIDRGKLLETICLLLAYKINYPENLFILRGDHESASINCIYGFYDECKRRSDVKLRTTFTASPSPPSSTRTVPSCAVASALTCRSWSRCGESCAPRTDTGLLCNLLWPDRDKHITGLERERSRRELHLRA